MSISELHSTGQPGPSGPAVLADAVARVRELHGTIWAARSDDELVETVELAQRLKSALAALEAEARQVTKTTQTRIPTTNPNSAHPEPGYDNDPGTNYGRI
jgi:hypothetical protein